MSDNMVMHFFSNSSNQSDHSQPSKTAKHEALMVGKPSSAQPLAPCKSSVSTTAVAAEDLPEHSSSGDSDDNEEKLMSVRAKIATLKEEMLKASESQKPLHQLKQLIKEENTLLRAKIATLEEQLQFEYQNLCPTHLKELN